MPGRRAPAAATPASTPRRPTPTGACGGPTARPAQWTYATARRRLADGPRRRVRRVLVERQRRRARPPASPRRRTPPAPTPDAATDAEAAPRRRPRPSHEADPAATPKHPSGRAATAATPGADARRDPSPSAVVTTRSRQRRAADQVTRRRRRRDAARVDRARRPMPRRRPRRGPRRPGDGGLPAWVGPGRGRRALRRRRRGRRRTPSAEPDAVSRPPRPAPGGLVGLGARAGGRGVADHQPADAADAHRRRRAGGRRCGAPSSRGASSFRLYVWLGVVIVVIRVAVPDRASAASLGGRGAARPADDPAARTGSPGITLLGPVTRRRCSPRCTTGSGWRRS